MPCWGLLSSLLTRSLREDARSLGPAGLFLGPLERWQPLRFLTGWLPKRRRRPWGRAWDYAPIRWHAAQGRHVFRRQFCINVVLVAGFWCFARLDVNRKLMWLESSLYLYWYLIAGMVIGSLWRLWTREVLDHTWSTLCLTPYDINRIIAEKWSTHRSLTLPWFFGFMFLLAVLLIEIPTTQENFVSNFLLLCTFGLMPVCLFVPLAVIATSRLGWPGLLLGGLGVLLWKYANLCVLDRMNWSSSISGISREVMFTGRCSVSIVVDLVLLYVLKRAMTWHLTKLAESD